MLQNLTILQEKKSDWESDTREFLSNEQTWREFQNQSSGRSMHQIVDSNQFDSAPEIKTTKLIRLSHR